jgi:DNA helicase-2/ATP-dependent DNA helicase PcrA
VQEDLTTEQRAAVTHPGGPLMIVAGAGTGKTRVLCRRLAWLVDQGYEPGRVLGVTFTRQAAEELRIRAEDLIGRSHETLRVSTLHSWAQDVVRRHGVDQGLAPALAPADPELRKMIVLDRIGELDLRAHRVRGDLARLVDEIITRIDRCRDELVGADDYLSWAEEAINSATGRDQEVRARREWEFARTFVAHDAWLTAEGLEDFGMSIVRALDLARGHADRLAAIREEVQHLLVDEFQDTNHAQTELLFAVADPAGSIVVVGDDDQGIYRFRGASGKNMSDFRRRFPDAAEIRLERNYRSTQAILDAAGAVVAPIPGRLPKTLVARTDAAGPTPRFLESRDPDTQAQTIAEEVVARAAAGIPYHEQAVLMRAVRLESAPIIEAFERAGIPHQVRGGVGLMERAEVRTAVAWLRAAVDPTDGPAHLRIVGDAAWSVPWALAAGTVAANRNRPVADVLCTAIVQAGIDTPFPDVLDAVGREVADSDARAAIRAVIDLTGLRRRAIATGGAQGASRVAALGALERLVDELATARPALAPAELAQLLSRLADLGYRGDAGAPLERDGVQVMTIHQAKGLEFDAVSVVGLTHYNWPGRYRPGPDIPDALLPEALPRDSDAHVAEARRLAYVALTRARTHLTLSWVRASATGVPQSPSRFVANALEASGDPDIDVVEDGPVRAQLEAVGTARARFEDAAMRAAARAAAGAWDTAADPDLADALDGLIRARAAVLAGPPDPTPPPVPTRVPRPGVTTSITGIARYRSCPLQYRFAHVDRIPPRPDPSREIGTAAHAALEAFFRPGQPDADAAELVGGFRAALSAARIADTAQARHALALAEQRFPDLVARTRSSGIVPVAVERPFTLHLGPHRLHGRIDRVDRLPQGGFGLIDYKTGSPPTGNADDEGRMVMRLYLAGARAAWQVEPRVATLEYILEGQNRRENPDGNEIAAAVEIAHATLDEIAAERFPPQPSWACRTCDYRLLCPAMDR